MYFIFAAEPLRKFNFSKIRAEQQSARHRLQISFRPTYRLELQRTLVVVVHRAAPGRQAPKTRENGQQSGLHQDSAQLKAEESVHMINCHNKQLKKRHEHKSAKALKQLNQLARLWNWL